MTHPPHPRSPAACHDAHLATVRPDGAPQSSVTRFDWDDRVLRVSRTRSRQSGLERDGGASCSTHDAASTLRALEVRGRVVDVTQDDDVASSSTRLQHRYGMEDPIDDAAERVAIVVTHLVVNGWGVAAHLLG